MKNHILLFAAAVTAFATLASGQSAVPETMNYQAVVTDSAGNLIGVDAPVNREVEFRIYGVSSGGTPLWAEKQTVTIYEGNISTQLGLGTSFDGLPRPDLSTVFDGSQRFLGIKLDTAANEFSPRQQIVANPYAFTSKVAENALDADTADTVDASSALVLNWNDVLFGASTDTGYALRTGNPLTFASTNIDGPVLVGNTGGALGTSSGGDTLALQWNSSGDLTASNNVTVSNDLTVNGNLVVPGGIDAQYLDLSSGSLNIGDDLTIGGDLNVGGTDASGTVRARTIYAGSAYIWANNLYNMYSVESPNDRFTVKDDLKVEGVLELYRDIDSYYTSTIRILKGLEVIGDLEVRGDGVIFDAHSGTDKYIRWDENDYEIEIGSETTYAYSNGQYYRVTYDGDNNWDFESDARLKKDIRDYEPLLDRLLQVRLRRYTFLGTNREQVGVIAQELQPLFPSMVGENTHEEDGATYLTVAYSDFGMLAVRGIQELKAEQDEEREFLHQRVDELEAENAFLRERLAAIESRLDAAGL
jgi:hypothetical protein